MQERTPRRLFSAAKGWVCRYRLPEHLCRHDPRSEGMAVPCRDREAGQASMRSQPVNKSSGGVLAAPDGMSSVAPESGRFGRKIGSRSMAMELDEPGDNVAGHIPPSQRFCTYRRSDTNIANQPRYMQAKRRVNLRTMHTVEARDWHRTASLHECQSYGNLMTRCLCAMM